MAAGYSSQLCWESPRPTGLSVGNMCFGDAHRSWSCRGERELGPRRCYGSGSRVVGGLCYRFGRPALFGRCLRARWVLRGMSSLERMPGAGIILPAALQVGRWCSRPWGCGEVGDQRWQRVGVWARLLWSKGPRRKRHSGGNPRQVVRWGESTEPGYKHVFFDLDGTVRLGFKASQTPFTLKMGVGRRRSWPQFVGPPLLESFEKFCGLPRKMRC